MGAAQDEIVQNTEEGLVEVLVEEAGYEAASVAAPKLREARRFSPLRHAIDGSFAPY